MKKSVIPDTIIETFLFVMGLEHTASGLENLCVNFLKALSKVGGPVTHVADVYRQNGLRQ